MESRSEEFTFVKVIRAGFVGDEDQGEAGDRMMLDELAQLIWVHE